MYMPFIVLLVQGGLWRIKRVSMLFFVFETDALPPDLFLQEVEAVRVVVVEGKSAAPETAVDVGSFVSRDDLGLGCTVYRRQTRLLTG